MGTFLGAAAPHVTNAGPGWRTILVTFLVGAAVTLVVQLVIQLWLVPRVETRRRREDRWERDVRELGELLTTLVRRHSEEARTGQSTFRFLRQRLEEVSGVDQDKLAQMRKEESTRAYQATQAFHDLVNSRVDWLVDRIKSFESKPRIISEFDIAARRYWIEAMGPSVPEYDDRSDNAFDEDWEKERKARKALEDQVKRLANLPNPPRVPLRHRLKQYWQRTWRWLNRLWQRTWAFVTQAAKTGLRRAAWWRRRTP